MESTKPSAGYLFSIPSFTRRNVLTALVLGVILLLTGYFVVHAAGASHHAAQHRTHRHARRAHVATCARLHRRGSCAPAHHARPKKRRAVPAVHVPPDSLHAHRYALGLVPVIDRTRHAFDAAARDLATIGDSSTLNAACIQDLSTVQTLLDEADGIPHPYPWYTSVGKLHFGMMDVFHRMTGALNLCITATGNGDGEAQANAANDADGADHSMRWLDDHVRALAARP